MPKYVDTLTIEQALIKAGNGHTFQKRALFIMGLQFIVAGVLNVAVTQLFFFKSNFVCMKTSETQALESYNCPETEFCEQIKSKITQEGLSNVGTVVSYFNLYCAKQLIVTVLLTSYFLGGSMGSLYYGEQMEYRQGRYTVMIETLLLMGFTCCVSILSPSPYILSIAFFFANFFQRGFFNSSMILFFEISSENLQKTGPPLLLTCWGIGELIGPYVIQIFGLDWYTTMLILVGGPAVALSILIKFMKESPRILTVRRRFEEARWVLAYVAAVNGRDLPKDWILEDEAKITELKSKMAAITNQQNIQEISKGYNYSSIFRYNSTRVRMFCLLYLYGAIVLGQFITASEIKLSSKMNRLQTNLFLGLIESAGFLASAYASLNYERYDQYNLRKSVIKSVLILGALFHFLIAAMPFIMWNPHYKELLDFYDKIVYTVEMMILTMCRLILSFGFGFINVYALEVFPTSLRHYGFSGLVFLSEFLFVFEDVYVGFCTALGLNPAIGIFAILLGGLFTMQKLRETFDQPLKENVEEMSEELLNNIYIA